MAENRDSSYAGAGGFTVPSMPSPAPSSTSTIKSVSGLPHPRSHALRPGSAKEDQVRHFVSDRVNHITRRFLKRTGKAPPGSEVEGYNSMRDLCKDLEGVINIVWLSGTPNLQIPLLLHIAGEFNTWLAGGLPPSPAATFAILHKLDHCFASLLSGEDIETHEPLPGFDGGRRAGMSKTDMVRCRSVVEEARVLIVEVMSRGREEDGVEEDEGSDEDGDGSDATFLEEDEEKLFMDVARVYENTLVKLGETLGETLGDVAMTDTTVEQ
ncbi:hypothetical protein C8A03DRAFT_18275 [Achaetomium macrosporum]|uniref:Meiotic recombination protein DMC1 n=1 Tax=Achaetomium macrosporum TaxID=79813 RepID=A0AAN7C3U6_9PEZI|nr:hypothetical protein C8A03DRAFT_18275 [Achaetomium macrosporum]